VSALSDRLRRWARGIDDQTLAELAAVALGCILRLAMARTFDARLGYDVESHWKYIEWFKTHWTLPDMSWSRETYHPPLYYAFAALFAKAGVGWQGIERLSIALGCLRLGLFAVGLRLALREWPLARIFALALAAVMPASIHLDGMINCEGMLGFWSAAAMVLTLTTFAAEGRKRLAWAGALGLALGLALLSKVSSLSLLGGVGLAALVELARGGGLKRALPLAAVLAGAALVSGWYFAHNVSLYGKPFLAGYDGPEKRAIANVDKTPLLQRRSLGWLLGWTADIYRQPSWPSGYEPTPHIGPVLVASTFSDYYKYRFEPTQPGSEGQTRTVPTPAADALARASVAAGTLIAAATAAGFVALLIAAWRRRAYGGLALLAGSAWAVAGQIAFAWRWPIDWEGPVKGVYLQFAALPMCAAFGVAVEWAWRRPRARPAAWVALVAVAVVAAYVGYCRWPRA
jgi:4-amino-4-deoxy-L-arabinose transferase-like glycosyltransferase